MVSPSNLLTIREAFHNTPYRCNKVEYYLVASKTSSLPKFKAQTTSVWEVFGLEG